MQSEDSGEVLKGIDDMPGGKLGFQDFDSSSPAKAAVDKWKEVLDGDEWGFSCMKDPDFVEAFIAKVPDHEQQIQYVINTSRFLNGSQEADPAYVLFFRRTIPSETPKPEHHWTSDYISARRGLTREIPEGPYRLYTVILGSTLADVLSDGGYSSTGGPTDGEIKVDHEVYDQKRSLVKFRPKDQQLELDAYQKTQEAMSLNAIREKLKEAKTEK